MFCNLFFKESLNVWSTSGKQLIFEIFSKSLQLWPKSLAFSSSNITFVKLIQPSKSFGEIFFTPFGTQTVSIFPLGKYFKSFGSALTADKDSQPLKTPSSIKSTDVGTSKVAVFLNSPYSSKVTFLARSSIFKC